MTLIYTRLRGIVSIVMMTSWARFHGSVKTFAYWVWDSLQIGELCYRIASNRKMQFIAAQTMANLSETNVIVVNEGPSWGFATKKIWPVFFISNHFIVTAYCVLMNTKNIDTGTFSNSQYVKSCSLVVTFHRWYLIRNKGFRYLSHKQMKLWKHVCFEFDCCITAGQLT